MAALVGYGIVAMAALGYGGPWLWRAITATTTATVTTTSRSLEHCNNSLLYGAKPTTKTQTQTQTHSLADS